MNFDDFCSLNNIILVYKKLDSSIRGFCVVHGEHYYVIINDKLDIENRKKTVSHEVIHILEDHFRCPIEDACNCENEVHRIIKDMKYMFEQSNEFYINIQDTTL